MKILLAYTPHYETFGEAYVLAEPAENETVANFYIKDQHVGSATVTRRELQNMVNDFWLDGNWKLSWDLTVEIAQDVVLCNKLDEIMGTSQMVVAS